MPKDRVLIDFEIIWKKINNSLTEDEELLLSQWLNESDSHRSYFDKAVRYYLEGSGFNEVKSDMEKAWKALINKGLNVNQKNLRWIVSLSAATAVAIFLMITY